MAELQLGQWIPLDESSTVQASMGVPKKGQTIELTYIGNPMLSTAKRIGDATSDKGAFKAKTTGATVMLSANT